PAGQLLKSQPSCHEALIIETLATWRPQQELPMPRPLASQRHSQRIPGGHNFAQLVCAQPNNALLYSILLSNGRIVLLESWSMRCGQRCPTLRSNPFTS